MGGPEIGIALDHLLKLGERFGIAVRFHQRHRIIGACDGGEGIERQSNLELVQCLINPVQGGKAAKGVKVMSGGIVRIQFNGPAELRFRVPGLEICCQRHAQRDVRFRKRIVQLQGLASRFFGDLPALF